MILEISKKTNFELQYRTLNQSLWYRGFNRKSQFQSNFNLFSIMILVILEKNAKFLHDSDPKWGFWSNLATESF